MANSVYPDGTSVMLDQDGVLVASLKALTLDAQSAIHGRAIVLTEFPFRVGRESRGPNASWQKDDERRTGGAPNNDLYLWERGSELHVSREHFQIECVQGQYFLVDRQSALGTWVEGEIIGGHRRGGRIELRDGDVIIVGTHHSGFIFKFCLQRAD